MNIPIYAKMETALIQRRLPEWWMHQNGDMWVNKDGGTTHRQWLTEVPQEGPDFVALINAAETIFRSNLSWEVAYDTIFGLKIWQAIRDAEYAFDWCDPDTTYEADVTAYCEALFEFRSTLHEHTQSIDK